MKKDRDGDELFLAGLLLGAYGKDISRFLKILFHRTPRRSGDFLRPGKARK